MERKRSLSCPRISQSDLESDWGFVPKDIRWLPSIYGVQDGKNYESGEKFSGIKRGGVQLVYMEATETKKIKKSLEIVTPDKTGPTGPPGTSKPLGETSKLLDEVAKPDDASKAVKLPGVPKVGSPAGDAVGKAKGKKKKLAKDTTERFKKEVIDPTGNTPPAVYRIKTVVKKKKRANRKLWDRTVYTVDNYFLPAAKILSHVLMIVFWVWLVLSFSNILKSEEDKPQRFHSVCKVDGADDLNWHIRKGDKRDVTVRLKVYGPFVSYDKQKELEKAKKDKASRKFIVKFERWIFNNKTPLPLEYDKTWGKGGGGGGDGGGGGGGGSDPSSTSAPVGGGGGGAPSDTTRSTSPSPAPGRRKRQTPNTTATASSSKNESNMYFKFDGGKDEALYTLLLIEPDDSPEDKLTFGEKADYDHKNNPYDYNYFERNDVVLHLNKCEHTGKAFYYAIGFGMKEASTNKGYYIPFSFEFVMSFLTEDAKMAAVSIVVYTGFIIMQFNKAVSAGFGLATGALCVIKTGQVADLYRRAKWFEFEWLFYVFSCSLLSSLLIETNIHSFLAWYWLKLTQCTLLPTLILIQVVPPILCFYFCNVLVVYCITPFFIRTLELLGKDPIPAIYNLFLIANIYGKAYAGNYQAKFITNYMDEVHDLQNLAGIKSRVVILIILIGAAVSSAWIALYIIVGPLDDPRGKMVQENDQLMDNTDIASVSIPDTSRNWHRVRTKLRAIKSLFAFESKEIRAREKQFGPEQQKPYNFQLEEIAPECGIRSKRLFLKILLCLTASLTLTVFFFYNFLPLLEKYWLAGIGALLALLMMLAVASRDLELLLKRVDWESILLFACLFGMGSMFEVIFNKNEQFLWEKFGKQVKGSIGVKAHKAILTMVGWGTVSGLFNDHIVFTSTSKLLFKVAKEYDNFNKIVLAWHLITCFWGMGTPVGTAVNIIGSGMLNQHGFYRRAGFFRMTRYCLPFTLPTVLLTYLYQSFLAKNEKLE